MVWQNIRMVINPRMRYSHAILEEDATNRIRLVLHWIHTSVCVMFGGRTVHDTRNFTKSTDSPHG